MFNKIFGKIFIGLHTQQIISSNNSHYVELELYIQIIVCFLICFLFDSLFVCLRSWHEASVTLIFRFYFLFPFYPFFLSTCWHFHFNCFWETNIQYMHFIFLFFLFEHLLFTHIYVYISIYCLKVIYMWYIYIYIVCWTSMKIFVKVLQSLEVL